MDLPLRTVAKEDLVSHEQEMKIPDTDEWPNVVHLVAGGDPLSAVKGMLLGVISSGIVWGPICWGISSFIY